MTNPLVSVIIPCFKMGRFISEALASVGTQTYGEWEIIAVDDCGPDDGTREAVVDFMRKFPDHHVQYIRHEINKGVSAARNTAVKVSRGELLAFLDPDDKWLPTKIERQVNRLGANPSAVACFSLGLIERQGQSCLYAQGTNIIGYLPSPELDVDTIMIANLSVFFPFSSVMLRRMAFDKVGWFQESLPFQNEDRLLMACIATFGSITGFDEPLCIYRVHDTSVTTSVIKSDAVKMVEFDLTSRIALWLRSQRQNRLTGLKVLKGPVCRNFRAVLKSRSWMKWCRIVVELSARLIAAYPLQAWLLVREFLRELLIRAFVIRGMLILIHRLRIKFTSSHFMRKEPKGRGME